MKQNETKASRMGSLRNKASRCRIILMAWIAQQAQFFTSPDVKVRGLWLSQETRNEVDQMDEIHVENIIPVHQLSGIVTNLENHPHGSMATVSEGTANPLVTSHHTQVTLPFRRHPWIHMDLIIPNIILIFTKPRKIPDSSPNSPARTSSLPMAALVIRVWSKCKHTSTRLNLSKLHHSQMCQKVTPSHVVVVLEFCLLACM